MPLPNAGPACPDAAIHRAATALASADALLIMTGAGMGVDSGLGTYRGKHAGVWGPLRALGLDYSQAFTPHQFVSDARLAWAFFQHQYRTYTAAAPHAGYDLLARWGAATAHGMFCVTSNVDGHWRRVAGVQPDAVWEVHGSVCSMQYAREGTEAIWPTDISRDIDRIQVPEWDLRAGESVEVQREEGGPWERATVSGDGRLTARLSASRVRELPRVHAVRRGPGGPDLCRAAELSPLPTCPAGTDAAVRPNVKMFQDTSFASDRVLDEWGRYDGWMEGLPPRCRLAIVEVGAGVAVRSIREKAEAAAARFEHSTLIRINLEHSAVPAALARRSVSIGGTGALAALQQIDVELAKLQ